MSHFEIYVTPEALAEIKELPGHIRQRVQRAVEVSADELYPAQSKTLATPTDLDVYIHNLRLDQWRVVYMITVTERLIDVVAVRKRPPFDNGDVQTVLNELE